MHFVCCNTIVYYFAHVVCVLSNLKGRKKVKTNNLAESQSILQCVLVQCNLCILFCNSAYLIAGVIMCWAYCNGGALASCSVIKCNVTKFVQKMKDLSHSHVNNVIHTTSK